MEEKKLNYLYYFVVGITISVAICFIISKSFSTDVTIPIICAFISVLGTIIGVYLTINYEYIKRKDDFEKREKEKIEDYNRHIEEKKEDYSQHVKEKIEDIKRLEEEKTKDYIISIKPLFFPYNGFIFNIDSILHFKEKVSGKKRGKSDVILGSIKNTNKIEFIVDSIEINEITFDPDFEKALFKECIGEITVFTSIKRCNMERVILNYHDIDNNKYSCRLYLDEKYNQIEKIEEMKNE